MSRNRTSTERKIYSQKEAKTAPKIVFFLNVTRNRNDIEAKKSDFERPTKKKEKDNEEEREKKKKDKERKNFKK